MNRTSKDYLVIMLKGMAMGAADVVPGVSGGTIAFISGIYEELLNSISNINLTLFKTLKKEGVKAAWQQLNGNFLVSLFVGVFISIISLAKVISWMLISHPILLWSFFFGLVLASIIYIAKQITKMDRILYSAFKKDMAPLEMFLAIVAIFSFPISCLVTQLFFTKTNSKPKIPNAGKNLIIISIK